MNAINIDSLSSLTVIIERDRTNYIGTGMATMCVPRAARNVSITLHLIYLKYVDG